ncbi:MAG TPA: NAD(P)/FAD-dependent oxidoreductase [Terriglobales bacterium]|jgi:phytoene dehydrogenase-like protein|nr:NAD(P)/FAD-dependent oxidoreductase [Terriglobales bacterium]
MSNSHDVVIIGGGHNGLVAAFYLARAGYKPLVLERRNQVGGAAITEEFHPGFRASLLAHSAGPLRPEVVRDMQLEKHGLKMITPAVDVTALSPDGRALVLYRDIEKAAADIAKISKSDAAKYREFHAALEKTSRIISKVLTLTPPEISRPSKSDLFGLLQLGRSVRGSGKKNTYDLLRWGPMAIADLVAEFFENDLLRAVIAARGIFGTFLGPWSAGTALVLLLRAAADANPAGGNCFAAGGMGAITQAMAKSAQQAGAEILTGAEVAEIKIKDGAVRGVALVSGEEIQARAVISNADPKRTFLKLMDPVLLSPTFTKRLQNFRMNGTVAKINLALSGLPSFSGLDGNNDAVSGRIHIGPGIDYLERAFDESKYGNFSRAPYLEIAIPSLTDPSLAPRGQHVMSVYMQYAPYKLKNATWQDQRIALGDTVIKTIAQYAPDLPGKILHTQVITPLDLEEIYGLTGGQIFHGELALDQIFTMRPMLDWARYRTPIENLYLCGSGTHPGTGLTGASGANAAREILKDLKARR